jgi:protein-S-isoprenylcysteine O-methyltransferase Ste14
MNARASTSVLVAGVLAGTTTALLRRMEREYTETDTLSAPTVVTMYGTYGAYTMALAWAASQRVWPVRLPRRSCRTAGIVLAALGGGIALAGARPFGAGAQISGIAPGSLHVVGIYRYSRNPQYLGLGLAATGTALTTRSAFAGLLAAGVWAAYRRWIPSEESHLTRTFGNEYTDYQVRVRRWLGSSPGWS